MSQEYRFDDVTTACAYAQTILNANDKAKIVICKRQGVWVVNV